jgi:hypothetical protein
MVPPGPVRAGADIGCTVSVLVGCASCVFIGSPVFARFSFPARVSISLTCS